MKDNLGNRMKEYYENKTRYYLTRRIPVIMRLDGKAFHTLTRKISAFNEIFQYSMIGAAQFLIQEIQGAKCAYVQSDEISILITDFDKLTTDSWFGYNIQKMVSVSASMASVMFTRLYGETGFFDSRVFNIPKEEVVNYFRWRQKDWIRNSVQILGQQHYSQKELHGKKKSDIHEMLYKKGVNWSNLPSIFKNGTFVDKNTDYRFNVNFFAQDRIVVENYLKGNE